MSQEEAHRRPAAVRRSTDEVVAPQRPLFTARTDESTGVIRASGSLDLVGAEALCRTVSALHRLGHRPVIVRLGSVTIADDAYAPLADLCRELSGSVHLVPPVTARPDGPRRS